MHTADTPSPLPAPRDGVEICIGSEHQGAHDDAGRHAKKIYLQRQPGQPSLAPRSYFYEASSSGAVPSWAVSAQQQIAMRPELSPSVFRSAGNADRN